MVLKNLIRTVKKNRWPNEDIVAYRASLSLGSTRPGRFGATPWRYWCWKPHVHCLEECTKTCSGLLHSKKAFASSDGRSVLDVKKQIYMAGKDELAGNDQVLDLGLTVSWLQARVDVCVTGWKCLELLPVIWRGWRRKLALFISAKDKYDTCTLQPSWKLYFPSPWQQSLRPVLVRQNAC